MADLLIMLVVSCGSAAIVAMFALIIAMAFYPNR